jgi:hypothetical protein
MYLPWEVMQAGGNMGITPITYLTPLPLPRSLQAELDPLPMERVENSARTGDEKYSPSNGRSPRGSEDDTPDEELEAAEEQTVGESPSSLREPSDPRTISFFA